MQAVGEDAPPVDVALEAVGHEQEMVARGGHHIYIYVYIYQLQGLISLQLPNAKRLHVLPYGERCTTFRARVFWFPNA